MSSLLTLVPSYTFGANRESSASYGDILEQCPSNCLLVSSRQFHSILVPSGTLAQNIERSVHDGLPGAPKSPVASTHGLVPIDLEHFESTVHADPCTP